MSDTRGYDGMKLILTASACLFVLTRLWLLINAFPGNSAAVHVSTARRSEKLESRSLSKSSELSSPPRPQFDVSPTDPEKFCDCEFDLISVPSPPPRSATLQDGKPTRAYVIRLVDSASKEPIAHAKVWVELGDPLKDQRNGYTDTRGAFTFVWQLTRSRTKTHITVEAVGYATIDNFGVLTEEQLIRLNKIKT